MIHRHRWQIVAVKHVRVYDDSFGYDRFGTPKTEQLQRCTRCPKVRVQQINGTWTLEQLTGGV